MNLRQTRDFLTKVPFNTLLGMRLRRVHRDGVTIDCTLRDDLRNSVGVAHGGVSAAMADAAVGIALQRHFGGKRRIATVDVEKESVLGWLRLGSQRRLQTDNSGRQR